MRQRETKNSAQHARRFNSVEIEAQWRGLREEFRLHQLQKATKAEGAKGDTVAFFTEVCHLKPFVYQLALADLYRQNQFLAVRWPRQTGKSTFIGGLLLQDAYENKDLNIAFIGSSWRQTKLNLRRVASFVAISQLEPAIFRELESASRMARL